MSSYNPAISTPATTRVARASLRSLLRASATATVGAAVATETLTAVVRAAGVDLAVGNPGGTAASVVSLKAGACAIAIVLTMVAGTLMAVLINRFSERPARTYRITATVLGIASLAAPLTAAGTSSGTKTTLIAAHLIAVAVIVPIVSRSLNRPH